MKEGKLEMTHTAEIAHETWMHCYDDSWQEGEITAESFSHPAKMSKGLVYKIVKEGLLRGWWKRSDIIADPFGGIGSTGIACAAFGIQAVLCELEAKFVALANENFRLHAKAWTALNLPHPIIMQGDSRQLASIVRASGCVTSPPWAESLQSHDAEFENRRQASRGRNIEGNGHLGSLADYGSTPGQIGAMTEGPFGVVTSPPFSDAGVQPSGGRQFTRKDAAKRAHPVEDQIMTTEGNIASLPIGAITSPPYGNRVDDRGVDKEGFEMPDGKYGEAEGQMGNLRIAAVTSPPFGKTEPYQDKNFRLNDGRKALPQGQDGYGDTNGQIGQESQETYWQAVEQVYREVYELFSPGSVMACVVKSFVRKKQIVDLPSMTLALLERIGFEGVLWADAKLTSETQPSMLEEVPDYTKARKSFFRRLHEKKHPETAINEEVVLIVRRKS